MTAQAQNEFFNFHATGIAYLNRVRNVEPRGGKPYLAASLSVLVGPKDRTQYSYVDVIVSGTEAIKVVEDLMNESNEKSTKVLISFRVGDLFSNAFKYSSGERNGEIGHNIRARLIKVFWAKVNGELVYEAPKADEDAPASESEQHEPEPETRQPERTTRQQDDRRGQRAAPVRRHSHGERPSTRRAA
ncbi:DUF3577 domain-containing protein [Burkholderia glumae]|uniref:DUF3577 domain-containing protein n=1 Tax=Burkholderia glumae TaxID=337 RepID=UPI002036EF88|nr:DUF3577 domain-containing protein [Burkholderia glumae]MCM2552683.1 DUF3577 domain-containing protein [Burkholderia glumae]MCR1769749.1 DUF3577 domain-containing protein [Burkholderia glumae]